MKYEKLDSLIRAWAEKNSIPLLDRYRDDEVRAFEITRNSGRLSFQIWIDPPDEFGNTVVHAWDRGEWRVDFDADFSGISDALDHALNAVMERQPQA